MQLASAEKPNTPESIQWNKNVKLILADVDQTVADDFLPADPAMVKEISGLLAEGKSFFFVTGSPLNRLKTRLIDGVPAHLRSRIVVSHCSGAEVWGYDDNGDQMEEPFYSLYDEVINDEHKQMWRSVMEQLLDEFKLTKHPVQPVEAFRQEHGSDPFSVIYEDRGPQITIEVVNGYNLDDEQRAEVKRRLPHTEEVVDLREPIMARAEELFAEHGLPVTPRLGGVFAVDMALKGVSKKSSIIAAFQNDGILQRLGFTRDDLEAPDTMEIWGDRFDRDVGTDRHMCEAVDPRVRAIDFRREDPARFPAGFNIVVWNGEKELHEGALEYLQSRRKD